MKNPTSFRSGASWASMALAVSVLIFSSCRFQSYPAAYKFQSGVTYMVQYASDVQAKVDGSSANSSGAGSKPYSASSEGTFSFRATPDTSKGQAELVFTVDTLQYHSAERSPEEDQYMVGRLKKYRAKMVLTRSGQLLSLEEEPGLPPVEFSTLNFGRMLLYGLTSFPSGNIREGMHWEITQSILDKFHPDSRVIKRYTVVSLPQSSGERHARCKVELEIYLDEDLGGGAGGGPASAPSATVASQGGSAPTAGSAPTVPSVPSVPTMTGKGEVEFNLDKGRPISAELEIDGRFISNLPPKTGDSAQVRELPVKLLEHLHLRFPEG